eukprot:CAMPEP_0173073090 /NCGR_PEP_ID=MMETSP1102-20130122/10194_1 /TAXON_ID=49646 /ORGANISM="Geminigera sp., Strain Caron Lab Isolate" /LENGTH=279 /DNA_ID=CAMNT_0013941861 /DNA_START=104 /DNA_END=943 /DNA_ORIENTATION=+
MKQEMSEKAPLKALILGSATFKDTSFPSLPQVATARAALRTQLSASGYSSFNIVSADDSTQQEMLEALVKMSKDDVCPASSTLLIYIGGHIHYDPLTKQSFLVAHDSSRTQIASSAIEMKTLASEIARCSAKRKIILFDAMRHELTAASAAAVALSSSSSSTDLLGMRDSALDEFAERLRDVVICTSCRTDQNAHIDASEASLFMSAIIDAISGKFGGDKFRSEPRVLVLSKTCAAASFVTASSLLEYVAVAVHQKNPQQKPFHLNADALSRDFAISFL